MEVFMSVLEMKAGFDAINNIYKRENKKFKREKILYMKEETHALLYGPAKGDDLVVNVPKALLEKSKERALQLDLLNKGSSLKKKDFKTKDFKKAVEYLEKFVLKEITSLTRKVYLTVYMGKETNYRNPLSSAINDIKHPKNAEFIRCLKTIKKLEDLNTFLHSNKKVIKKQYRSLAEDIQRKIGKIFEELKPLEKEALSKGVDRALAALKAFHKKYK